MKPTLLIVDDLEETRQEITRFLSEDFEIVGTASNGQKAIEQVWTLQPQLVLMDVVMPVMSGIEATKAILERNRRPSRIVPKIVMLSSMREENIVLQAMDAGACEYLFKPVDPQKLKQILWDALQSAA